MEAVAGAVVEAPKVEARQVPKVEAPKVEARQVPKVEAPKVEAVLDET